MPPKKKHAGMAKRLGRMIGKSADRFDAFIEKTKAPGGYTTQNWFEDIAGFAEDMLSAFSGFGTSGNPTYPTIFIDGTNWPHTVNLTRTSDAELDSAIADGAAITFTDPLTLVGSTANPAAKALHITRADPEEDGFKLSIDVKRAATNANDPVAGLHVGAVFADDELVANVMVNIP